MCILYVNNFIPPLKVFKFSKKEKIWYPWNLYKKRIKYNKVIMSQFKAFENHGRRLIIYPSFDQLFLPSKTVSSCPHSGCGPKKINPSSCAQPTVPQTVAQPTYLQRPAWHKGFHRVARYDAPVQRPATRRLTPSIFPTDNLRAPRPSHWPH